MTVNGTALYADLRRGGGVPRLVLDAVAVAERFGFTHTVHPATGRFLASVAGGIAGGVIGETGTGTGVGVAWMLSGAPVDTRIVSVEIDTARAEATAALFADEPRVTIVHGDANALAEHGPFDMLVLDAPSTPGPLAWDSLDPTIHLRPHGLLIKDDLWPMTSWPPRAYDGTVDLQRARWLQHPDLFAAEITVAPGYGVLVARRRP